MRRSSLNFALVLLMATLAGCDAYSHDGQDARPNLARAQTMSLPDAYAFYVRTYRVTSPPLLKLADTFRRFGSRGTGYVAQRALRTTDPEEFNAALSALLILDYKCPEDLAQALAARGTRLKAGVSAAQICAETS